MSGIRKLFQARKAAKAFLALPREWRKITFYSEDSHSIVHFQGIMDALTGELGQQICYLTSDSNDSILATQNPRIKSFYVGDGFVRTTLFTQMTADVLITTMPDLETYYIKRSTAHPVHYVYVFHSMVSVHSQYLKGAFDHFDTIFCTGPYQCDEIRETEKVYGLPEKRLLEFGYHRLEALMDDVQRHRQQSRGPDTEGPRRMIVAPSWGDGAILEAYGGRLVQILLDAGYHTIVRPHPMTVKRTPEVIDQLRKRFQGHEGFRLQIDIRDTSTLYESHVMISDWSGVAIEYAFGCERPVIFIDVPKKNRNPEVDAIPNVPMEVSIREKIGRVVSPQDLAGLPAAVEEVYADMDGFIDQIRTLRRQTVFNLGTSGQIGAAYIAELAEHALRASS